VYGEKRKEREERRREEKDKLNQTKLNWKGRKERKG
jgi:hypothetical protein